MNRHKRLYQQGMEAIERRRELNAHIEEERKINELRDCYFQPSFYSYSSTKTSSPPKLYTESVTRLRKGVAMSMSV